MTTRLKLLSLVVVIFGILSTNCKLTSSGSSSSTQTIPASISPTPASLPVTSSTTFTSGGSGAALYTNWSLIGLAGPDRGSLSATRGQTTVYTAPSIPPVYPNQTDPTVQGKVTLEALVSGTGAADATFYITAPAITTGITPAAATVPLLRTQQFYAYAVGGTNNNVLFQVNGVTGGSLAYGYVSPTGLYQAPSVMPMTGNTFTLTVVSVADPNQRSSAIVTLQ